MFYYLWIYFMKLYYVVYNLNKRIIQYHLCLFRNICDFSTTSFFSQYISMYLCKHVSTHAYMYQWIYTWLLSVKTTLRWITTLALREETWQFYLSISQRRTRLWMMCLLILVESWINYFTVNCQGVLPNAYNQKF